MITKPNSNIINYVNLLIIVALLLIVSVSLNTATTSSYALNQNTNNTQSVSIQNELEWVEDNSEVFAPTQDDIKLSEQEVRDLGLENKLNKPSIKFKTDLNTELNIESGLFAANKRKLELNAVSDSINKDFQIELQQKRDLEAKQIEEFNKLSKIYKGSILLYEDVSNKINNILKTEDKGVKIVTDIVLDNIGIDHDLKVIVKTILKQDQSPSDYHKYNFDQDINKLKSLFNY